MSEFCVKCAQKDSEFEILRNRHFEETSCMRDRIRELLAEVDKLKQERDALILDVAFYGGNITNLSCNNK